MSATPLLYRVSDAAQRLGVSRSLLYQLIARGEVATVRIGSELRVTETALAAYVRAREREAEMLSRPAGKRRQLRAVGSR